MNSMSWPEFPESALFLVAVLPSPRDLEIARVLGWYRIPLRSAPKVVDVDYLAFYQPSAFGKEHSWRVEYYAAVKGHELTTRAELFREEKEQPRAGEEYYKIQLGPLMQLENPIPADQWRRLTFLYTTGRHILQAATLRDLVVGSDERPQLWQALCERAGKAELYQAGELEEPPDEILKAFLSGWMRDNSPLSSQTSPEEAG